MNSGIEPACQKCAFSHSFIIYRTLLCAGPRRCSQNRTACCEEGNGEALKGRVSPGTDCFGPHHLPGSARSRCVCVKGIFSCRDHGHSLRAFLCVLRKAGSSTREESHFTFPLGLPDAPVWLGSQTCFCRTFPNLQIPGGAGVLGCDVSGVGLQGQTGGVKCSPLPTLDGLYSFFPSLKTDTEALSFFSLKI